MATGLLGILLFAFWLALGLDPRDGGIGQGLFYVWRLLAAPVHLATNVLAPYTDRWPEALDGGAAVVVGLLPYALADMAWRRWQSARTRPACRDATGGSHGD